MLASRIYDRKLAGRPMPRHTARANAKKSSIRAAVEHVFAHQKTRFGLFIRTIGLARAEAKLTLGNICLQLRSPDLPRAPARQGGQSAPDAIRPPPDRLRIMPIRHGRRRKTLSTTMELQSIPSEDFVAGNNSARILCPAEDDERGGR